MGSCEPVLTHSAVEAVDCVTWDVHSSLDSVAPEGFDADFARGGELSLKPPPVENLEVPWG